MTRTEQIYFKGDFKWCHLVKNLYNAGNYEIRQRLFNDGKLIFYNELDKIMKLKEDEFNDYRKLPSGCAQHCLMGLCKTWKSWYRSRADWKKNPSKYSGMPKIPKYLKTNGERMITFTNQQCKIRNGLLKFPKVIGMEVKTRLSDDTDIREVRVVPKGIGYMIEIVYNTKECTLKSKMNRIAGIDLGVCNLVTMVDNIGNTPIIIKGGKIKSINQFYNKRKAYLKSICDRQGTKKTHRLDRLDMRRMWKIKNYFHKTSRDIVNICIERNIDTIVIGYNPLWKRNVNMGKKNNQSFVSIPFGNFINIIQYKARECGIEVVLHEESYTSKCSFLDNESIEKHDSYMGIRYKRGLFRSNDGIIVNADVNGAYNIMKKAFPNAFADGIEGVGLHPMRSSI